MNDNCIKVLLIEDNPGDARLIREMLSEDSNTAFELVNAEQLSKGLECLHGNGYDVILLDIGLPDSQGIDSLHAVLSKAHHIPIVIETGLCDEALAIRAVKAGAQDYLIKGQITSPLLSRSMRYAIERKKMEVALKRTERMTQARLRILESASASCFTLDDTLRLVLDEIEALTGSLIGFYYILEEDQETLSLQNWSTNTLSTMCTAEGKGNQYNISLADVCVDAVRERRPVIHNDYNALPHRKWLSPGHVSVIRELVVPVSRGTTIMAIIVVGNKATDYNEDDVQVSALFGDFSWEIVKSKRAEESLRRLTEELEQRVKERTAELEDKNNMLERMNRIFVKRELRIMELKELVSEQKKQLSRFDGSSIRHA